MSIHVTEEIVLETLSRSDAKAVFDLVENNRNQLQQYLYWVDDVTDIKSTEQYIDARINSGLPEARWYKIVFRNKVSGIFGVKSLCREQSEAEIGYWLSQGAQRYGVVSRIISEVCTILKSEGIHFLKINCLQENQASIAVAERSGAIHTGIISDYLQVAGQFQDLYTYTKRL